jgi:outer membrane protein assembly factor BamE
MRRIPLVLLPLLAACANVTAVTENKITEIFTPYHIDVRQGNFVTQEMAAQLKPGLTKDQVRFILGTPLVTDPFHANRWDYVYRLQVAHQPPEQRHMIVFFEDGRLARLGGDVAANEPEKVEAAASEARVIDITPDPNGPKTEPDNKVPIRPDEEQQRKKR